MNSITAEILLEKVRTGDFIPPTPLKEQLSRMNEESNDLIILCHRKR
jgi:3-deoxy-D-manno-octulosonic acid (KDO) 8-phosphate synthase